MKIIKPHDYQRIDIWRGIYKFKGRVMLGHDVGLGKSLMALHIARYFCGDSPIIIACPNSVKYGWENEVHKHTRFHTWILSGLSPPIRMPLHIPPVIILNWDILRAWVDTLALLRPKVIIGDESQNIKEPRSLRTKAFRRLCNGVPHVILCTGTPIENNPCEFFTSLNILCKKEFPAFRPFAFRFTNPRPSHWGMKFEGSRNEKELAEKIRQTCVIRRTKEEVLPDLPPVQRTIVPIDIPKKPRKEYDHAEKNFLSWLFKKNPGKALRAKHAIHLAKMTYLLGLIAKLKSPALEEWIKDFLNNTNKKLTVFGHHREFLENLKAKFPHESVLVYGGMNAKTRQAMIDQFASSKKTRLFLGSIMATGTGINKLQTVCSDIVIAELIWNPMKLLQTEGRLHRLGQKKSVSAYYVIANNTAEQILCKTLLKKQKIVKSILDGTTENLELDILEEVISELKKKVA